MAAKNTPTVQDVEGGRIQPVGTVARTNQDTVLPTFYNGADQKRSHSDSGSGHGDHKDGKEVVDLQNVPPPQETPAEDKGVIGRAIDPIRPYKKHFVCGFLVLFGLGELFSRFRPELARADTTSFLQDSGFRRS